MEGGGTHLASGPARRVASVIEARHGVARRDRAGGPDGSTPPPLPPPPRACASRPREPARAGSHRCRAAAGAQL
eukprot:scaffold4518_cov410-Prasinococcus_capsulatus_cf.AAC.40